jgi:hypothetical protein
MHFFAKGVNKRGTKPPPDIATPQSPSNLPPTLGSSILYMPGLAHNLVVPKDLRRIAALARGFGSNLCIL